MDSFNLFLKTKNTQKAVALTAYSRPSGLRSAQPEKKPPQRAAISVLFPIWWNFTTPLEPILRKNAELHKPPPLSTTKPCCAPPRKPFAYFLQLPRRDFLIWKRVFLVGARFGKSRNRRRGSGRHSRPRFAQSKQRKTCYNYNYGKQR